MPANLTHKYLKAEQAYRRAVTLDEELACLQEMLREIPKHKGTDRLQADLKHKIRRTKQDLEQQQKRGVGKPSNFRLARQGAGRVVLIGGPNAGKSQLLASLTRATPEVAPYPFTTRDHTPGMMTWEDVAIQVVDTPPITADLFDSTTQTLIRGADLVVLVVDLGADEGIDQLQELLGRLNNTKTRLAADSYLDEGDIGVSYTKTIVALNKSDLQEASERMQLLHELDAYRMAEYCISAQNADSLVGLRNAIFEALDIVRVYTKTPSEKTPDYSHPFTIHRGQPLLEVAEQVHKDFALKLKYAKVWSEPTHAGTIVKANYVPRDRDVVEFHV
ncbi:MAG: 50S ribosome-binding GTPase [Planctomycetaceae bacterium]|nr:50S ribosome-binding GTPase [Planctomycetales bacterium]MCB9875329.1 50S ribosome-binding GTPase [Planctomycetaceae bacterium]MCB9937250.1 50S ribosome-binding GTPase [Planctomycetaceae bacterium]